MTKFISAAIISLISILVLSASPKGQSAKPQSKPDFSGTWLLDAKKSNTGGLTTRPDLPITISHQDPEFKVVISSDSSSGQISKHEFVYFTDGRGEMNEATSVITSNPAGFKPDDLKNKKTESKTKWSGDKVVTRTRMRLSVTGAQSVEFEQVEEWKLSKDGKVLTQTSRTTVQSSDVTFFPASPQDKKRVFNRQ